MKQTWRGPSAFRIEAGEADPTWGDARRIATALGTSVDRLAALVEELEEEER